MHNKNSINLECSVARPIVCNLQDKLHAESMRPLTGFVLVHRKACLWSDLDDTQLSPMLPLYTNGLDYSEYDAFAPTTEEQVDAMLRSEIGHIPTDLVLPSDLLKEVA